MANTKKKVFTQEKRVTTIWPPFLFGSLKANATTAQGRRLVKDIYASGRAQDQGHSFSQYGPPSRQITCLFFFLSGNYFKRNIFVDFLLQQFTPFTRVRLTFRSSKPVLFTEAFKGWFTLWHKHKHKPTYEEAVCYL